tara:strand:+ start:159 stop:641 length:483 start_codon:yes stop_codon:yes gene_type:complete
MKELFHFKPDSTGVNLEDWLKESKADLVNVRLLYVLRANSDKNKITKIGVAGLGSGNPTTRLYDYVSHHGYNNPDNSSQGVKLFAAYTTKYNNMVEGKRSAIAKLENHLKTQMKDNIKGQKRGTERTSYPLSKIKSIIDKKIGDVEDTVTVPRRSERINH